MGNWSPYSEEWEKQHVQKVIEEAQKQFDEFEKKPWLYKKIFMLKGTIGYYCSVVKIEIRKFFDKEYRDRIDAERKRIEEEGLQKIRDFIAANIEDDAKGDS